VQYGGIALKGGSNGNDINELWYIGGIKCTTATSCRECRSDDQDCRLGILFMQPDQNNGDTKSYDAGGPIVSSQPSTTAQSTCSSTSIERTCTFFRPHSVSNINGMKKLTSTNLKDFEWKQVWNYGQFGTMQNHHDNVRAFSFNRDPKDTCLSDNLSATPSSKYDFVRSAPREL